MLDIKKFEGMHNKETYTHVYTHIFTRIDLRLSSKYASINCVCVVCLYLSCTVCNYGAVGGPFGRWSSAMITCMYPMKPNARESCQNATFKIIQQNYLNKVAC